MVNQNMSMLANYTQEALSGPRDGAEADTISACACIPAEHSPRACLPVTTDHTESDHPNHPAMAVRCNVHSTPRPIPY